MEPRAEAGASRRCARRIAFRRGWGSVAVEVGDRERPTVSGALEAGAGVWKPPLLEGCAGTGSGRALAMPDAALTSLPVGELPAGLRLTPDVA